MAYDDKRARDVDFSESYALMFNAFVVRADSAIEATAQVDRPGTKVAAVKGQTQEIVLSQTLKQGTMVLLDRKPDVAALRRRHGAEGDCGEPDLGAGGRAGNPPLTGDAMAQLHR
jgi:ABC-type amino acid transport substrate-binding protein